MTVLTALGLAGSAASAFFCLRSPALPGPPVRVLPAALGGGLFGFSPAMCAQALGHPNLVFDALVPVLLLLSVRLMIEEDPPRRTAVLLGVTAGAQVLIGEEVLFLTGVVVALLLLVLVVGRPREARRRLRRFSADAASRWAPSCWSPGYRSATNCSVRCPSTAARSIPRTTCLLYTSPSPRDRS